MKVFIQNTLTRNKDVFKPRKDKEVKMFTCGPSVYNLPHIGNYRTYLFEDVLERMLEFMGYRVNRMLNFTDVEDKAVNEARSRGFQSLSELTRPNEEQFFKDAQALKIRIPEQIPRSSTSVEQAVDLILRLLDHKHAYRHGRDVFFDPLTYEGFGRLYGLDMSQWPAQRVRYRKDTYPGQRWNLGDFILWHGAKKDDPFAWETRIGYGRPSWNIQDPAMISKHMGFELDIFCGGVDNLYRHHDYNLAVMESVSGTTLASCWMHAEHLLVDGTKMSKRKGNIVYPADLFQKDWSSDFLRFFLLSVHYRTKLDLNDESIDQAWKKFTTLRSLVREFLHSKAGAGDARHENAGPVVRTLLDGSLIFLADDLDIPSTVNFLIKNLEQLQAMKKDKKLSSDNLEDILSSLDKLDQILGFIF